MGTKELRDVAVDVAMGSRALFFDVDEQSTDGEKISEAAGAVAGVTGIVEDANVVAHGGFLSRAQGIPAASLLLHALQQNMRLVFCG